jgi:hypothetical protein
MIDRLNLNYINITFQQHEIQTIEMIFPGETA